MPFVADQALKKYRHLFSVAFALKHLQGSSFTSNIYYYLQHFYRSYKFRLYSFTVNNAIFCYRKQLLPSVSMFKKGLGTGCMYELLKKTCTVCKCRVSELNNVGRGQVLHFMVPTGTAVIFI